MYCVQGLELDIPVEDLMELFNHMDAKNDNKVSKVQFVDALNYVTKQFSGSMEAQAGRGNAKKGATNRQNYEDILKHVADAVHKK